MCYSLIFMRILHQKLKRCQKQQFANNLSLSHLPFQKWHSLLRPVLSVLLDKNYSLVGILLRILPQGDVQIESWTCFEVLMSFGSWPSVFLVALKRVITMRL